MEHFFELAAELLFGLAKYSPDKMLGDITYKSEFVVKHPVRKVVARLCATIIVIVVFSLLWIIVKHETRYLFAVFTFLGVILLIVSFISFSFQCLVTEECLTRSFWGLFEKRIRWNEVSCVRVIEQTDQKSVTIAIYNNAGKCIIDVDSDMENAWCVVKMAEYKNIVVKQEKDLSLKQISHL